MSRQIFTITTRGLEAISASEVASLPGMAIREVGYRRVKAVCDGNLEPVLGLRTVDDAYLSLAQWSGIGRPRSTLQTLLSLATDLDMDGAVRACRQLRAIPDSPVFSVTASFVGKRNYSTDEVKQAVAEGVRNRFPWKYSGDDRTSDLNLRVFIEHELAYLGVRLGKHPLHERPYKRVHLPGSLKPPVAAALVALAGMQVGSSLLDPFCGAGTIPIEAALSGLKAMGSDIDYTAIRASRENAAGIQARIEQWDAAELPLEDDAVDCVVSNLPWGRQIRITASLATLYKCAFRQILRVAVPSGRIVLLTSLPGLLSEFNSLCVERREISVFGQTPTVMIFENPR